MKILSTTDLFLDNHIKITEIEIEDENNYSIVACQFLTEKPSMESVHVFHKLIENKTKNSTHHINLYIDLLELKMISNMDLAMKQKSFSEYMSKNYPGRMRKIGLVASNSLISLINILKSFVSENVKINSFPTTKATWNFVTTK